MELRRALRCAGWALLVALVVLGVAVMLGEP
jgi:hypothetical protein